MEGQGFRVQAIGFATHLVHQVCRHHLAIRVLEHLEVLLQAGLQGLKGIGFRERETRGGRRVGTETGENDTQA